MPQPNKGPDVPSFAASAALAKADLQRLEQNPPEAGFVAKGQGVAREQDQDPKPQAPPVNMFSGTMQKLAVYGKPGCDPNEPVPGHVLYWAPEYEAGFIRNMLVSGWTFVDRGEVEVNDRGVVSGNTALDEKVRALVGASNMEPTYCVLMKKDKKLHEEHMNGPDSIEQRVHMVQEMQLAQGTYGSFDGRYSATNPPPGARSGLPSIKIGRYYKPQPT